MSFPDRLWAHFALEEREINLGVARRGPDPIGGVSSFWWSVEALEDLWNALEHFWTFGLALRIHSVEVYCSLNAWV